jgi:GNAT superfamily N-acetyltransferase
MKQLRPHLVESEYFSRVSFMMAQEKFRLFGAFNKENICVGVVGFQEQNRLSLGKIIYLADLVTDDTLRSHGIGARLLEVVEKEALVLDVNVIVLDSGLQRTRAHEFYKNHGYKTEAYSFRLYKPFASNATKKAGVESVSPGAKL